MRYLDLRVPAIDDYHGMVCAPRGPDWSFDSLAEELRSIEARIHAASPYPRELKIGPLAASSPRSASHPATPSPLTTLPGISVDAVTDGAEERRAFVMRVPSDDDEDDDLESPSKERAISGTRFSFTDVSLSESDNSDDDLEIERDCGMLMRKTRIDEGLLLELERENQLKVKEQVRNRLSKLEMLLTKEYEKSANAILQIDKHAKARQEMDRKLDDQYRRKIAEEIDHHLAILERNHAQISNAEEMNIRKDAAILEAKRKEKALQEEKSRQEKAKAEAEARAAAARIAQEAEKAARIVQEAEKAAFDAQNRASKEAAENVKQGTGKINADKGQADAKEKNISVSGETSNDSLGSHRAGIKVKADTNAIGAEEKRIRKHKELVENCSEWVANFSKKVDNCDRQVSRRLRQITMTVESVRTKADELFRIIKDPQYNTSASLLIFAKKVVGLCENPSGRIESTTFACGHVIVLVTSQIPVLMDIVLGEFNRACIYTVPKYIVASQSAVGTTEYLKLIGYQEQDGKMETSEKYRERVEAYMELFGALVQTEISGVQNLFGLNKGWTWLADFMNELPATAVTATALHAFLKMTGYSLHRRYKSQFRKIMAAISERFIPELKAQQNRSHGPIISKLELFIGKEEYRKEPEGCKLRTHLSSREFV